MSSHIPKVRDYQFDNLKFILITLVVVGHFIRPLIYDFPALMALYDVIFVFHMPFFVFVSGYFAKSSIHSDKRIIAVTKIFGTFLIFQTIYYFFYNYVMLEPERFSLIIPYWTLWYLMAMGIWLIILPYMMKLKHPLIVALVIGMIGGMWCELAGVFALSRVLRLLFFFVLGATFDKTKFEERVKNIPRAIPVLILSVVVFFIVSISDWVNCEWFYSMYSFSELGLTNLQGVVIQSLLYLIAVTMMFCLYFVIPKGKTVVSELGARTLYVYLLHGFVVQLFMKNGVFTRVETPIEQLSIITFAVLLTFVLSSKCVVYCTSWFVNPKVDRLFTKMQK